MKKIYYNLLMLSLAGLLIGGCKSSTSPGTSSTVTPGAGSTFKVVSQTHNSSNVLTSSDTSTDMVLATNVTYGGKTGVIKVMSTKSNGTMDTTYYHYESNGDVSVWADTTNGLSGLVGTSGWMTFPFASQTTTTTSADTNIDGFVFHMTLTRAGAGSGSVTVKGNSLSTENAKMTITMTGNVLGQAINQTTTTTIQFAPSIGYVAATSQPGTKDPISGQTSDSQNSFLIDYSVK